VGHVSGSVRSPDAVSVVPAYEGPEGAALASVAVGAHQTVGTAAVPGELAATHLAWPLEADGVPTGVFRGAVGAGGGSWQGSGAGGGQGVTCCQAHQHHHHHPRHQGHTGTHLGGRTVCDVCSLYCQIWT